MTGIVYTMKGVHNKKKVHYKNKKELLNLFGRNINMHDRCIHWYQAPVIYRGCSMQLCCSNFHISVLPGVDPGGLKWVPWKLLSGRALDEVLTSFRKLILYNTTTVAHRCK